MKAVEQEIPSLNPNTLPFLWPDIGSIGERILFERHNYAPITYREVFELANRLAAALSQSGLQSGDRVASILDKSAFAVVLYVACVNNGLIYCPIHADAADREMNYLLNHCEPALIVTRALSVASVHKAMPRAKIETLESDGSGSLEEKARALNGRHTHDFVPPTPSTPAALLYTSGTTGSPKAVLMSHGNLASNAAALKRVWHFGENDVLLHALPLHHTHGLFVAMNVALAAGARVRLLPKFDAGEVIQNLSDCTVMMGVPTFYSRLLKCAELSPESTIGIRLFVSGSAPLGAKLSTEFKQRTGHDIVERYGMTETGIIASGTASAPSMPGTIGSPLDNVDLRIANPSQAGVGQVEVRGPGVFGGYWSHDARNRADFTDDGFFITGDLGMVSSEGHLTLVGREKDVIITGGLNVYPKEVETQLREIAGIDDAAVVGIPHADYGEAVVAFVVLRPDSKLDERAIRAELKSRLAGYKQPKRVLSLSELPLNGMGKVQVNVLRDRFSELFS